MQSHVSVMEKEGNWATELEILALSDMLSVNIFTFSNGSWLKFSGKDIYISLKTKHEGLYLNHKNENHYDVVLDVGESSALHENNRKIDWKCKETDVHSKQRAHIDK